MSEQNSQPTFQKAEKKSGKKRWIFGGIAAVVIIIAIASGGGSDDKTEAASGNGSTTSSTEKTTTTAKNKATVTLAEYNSVKEGMTFDQVKAAFGGDPSSNSESSFGDTVIKTYSWAGDGLGDLVMIQFQNDKLVTKSQNGLG